MKAILEHLLAGDDLPVADARAAMGLVMDGEATPTQIAAFLVALRAKGETAEELAGCAQAMRAHVLATRPQRTDLVDTAGTGGDGASTFNISTAAALLAAAAGAGVAKHGNRAVSSRTGSADVLEALGLVIELDHAAVAAMIDDIGFGYLHAPNHHPAMRHAGPVRRELGIRTVMNLLGPLSNPVGAPSQVIGVPRPELVDLFARAVALLGTRRTLVVHGSGGIDELSPCGASVMAIVEGDSIRKETVQPRTFGFDRSEVAQLGGGNALDNAAAIAAVFAGARGPKRDAVVLNAGGALYAAGLADDLEAGVTGAAAAIDDGRAEAKVREIVDRTRTEGGVA